MNKKRWRPWVREVWAPIHAAPLHGSVPQAARRATKFPEGPRRAVAFCFARRRSDERRRAGGVFRSRPRAAVRLSSRRARPRRMGVYLRRESMPAALERFRTGLRRFAAAHGKPERYHETITTAYVLLIHERMMRRPVLTWEEFAAAHDDLLASSPSILERYYGQRRWGRSVRGGSSSRRTGRVRAPRFSPTCSGERVYRRGSIGARRATVRVLTETARVLHPAHPLAPRRCDV
jgi:hypothetical protein